MPHLQPTACPAWLDTAEAPWWPRLFSAKRMLLRTPKQASALPAQTGWTVASSRGSSSRVSEPRYPVEQDAVLALSPQVRPDVLGLAQSSRGTLDTWSLRPGVKGLPWAFAPLTLSAQLLEDVTAHGARSSLVLPVYWAGFDSLTWELSRPHLGGAGASSEPVPDSARTRTAAWLLPAPVKSLASMLAARVLVNGSGLAASGSSLGYGVALRMTVYRVVTVREAAVVAAAGLGASASLGSASRGGGAPSVAPLAAGQSTLSFSGKRLVGGGAASTASSAAPPAQPATHGSAPAVPVAPCPPSLAAPSPPSLRSWAAPVAVVAPTDTAEDIAGLMQAIVAAGPTAAASQSAAAAASGCDATSVAAIARALGVRDLALTVTSTVLVAEPVPAWESTSATFPAAACNRSFTPAPAPALCFSATELLRSATASSSSSSSSSSSAAKPPVKLPVAWLDSAGTMLGKALPTAWLSFGMQLPSAAAASGGLPPSRAARAAPTAAPTPDLQAFFRPSLAKVAVAARDAGSTRGDAGGNGDTPASRLASGVGDDPSASPPASSASSDGTSSSSSFSSASPPPPRDALAERAPPLGGPLLGGRSVLVPVSPCDAWGVVLLYAALRLGVIPLSALRESEERTTELAAALSVALSAAGGAPGAPHLSLAAPAGAVLVPWPLPPSSSALPAASAASTSAGAPAAAILKPSQPSVAPVTRLLTRPQASAPGSEARLKSPDCSPDRPAAAVAVAAAAAATATGASTAAAAGVVPFSSAAFTGDADDEGDGNDGPVVSAPRKAHIPSLTPSAYALTAGLTVNTAPSSSSLLALAAPTPSAGMLSTSSSQSGDRSAKAVANRLVKLGSDPRWAVEQGARAAAGSGSGAAAAAPAIDDVNGGLSEEAAIRAAVASSMPAAPLQTECIELDGDDDDDGGDAATTKQPPRAAAAPAHRQPPAPSATASAAPASVSLARVGLASLWEAGTAALRAPVHHGSAASSAPPLPWPVAAVLTSCMASDKHVAGCPAPSSSTATAPAGAVGGAAPLLFKQLGMKAAAAKAGGAALASAQPTDRSDVRRRVAVHVPTFAFDAAAVAALAARLGVPPPQRLLRVAGEGDGGSAGGGGVQAAPAAASRPPPPPHEWVGIHAVTGGVLPGVPGAAHAGAGGGADASSPLSTTSNQQQQQQQPRPPAAPRLHAAPCELPASWDLRLSLYPADGLLEHELERLARKRAAVDATMMLVDEDDGGGDEYDGAVAAPPAAAKKTAGGNAAPSKAPARRKEVGIKIM